MKGLVAALPLLAVMAAACEPTDRESLASTGVNAIAGQAAQSPVGPIPGPAMDSRPHANPYQARPDALADGRELFVRFNCSGCHGGRAGGGMGPSLRDVDWIYGSMDGQIFSSIAEGRAHGMPAWGTKLTEDQVWKLVAYIKSLRTSAEPNPPR
jgi:cytochrome c oxidase cbb3-type subunit III